MNKMHIVLSSAALSLLFGCGERGASASSTNCPLPAANFTIYVSPTGCDTNLGTRAAPLKTLEAAREAVRKLKKVEKRGGGGQWNVSNSTVQPSTSNLQPPHTICLLDGEYRLERPLALEAQDSGVVWRAEHRGQARLQGTRRLDWRRPGADDADRVALLPAAARDKVRVASIPGAAKIPLFLRGNQLSTPSNDVPLEVFSPKGRLTCARWPNDYDAMTTEVYDTHTFGVDAKRAKDWANEPDAWVFGLWCHDWIELHTPLRVVDAEKGRAAYPKQYACKLSCDMGFARPFHVYNVFAELDRPGEWVVDRARRQLWLWPTEDGEAEAAIGAGLVTVSGAHDIAFDGLVFERCRKTAVKVSGSDRVKIVASTFRDTCSWGVEVRGGSDCRVEGCDLYELGEGGIRLDGGDMKTLTPGNHAAVNCHIHDIGRTLFNYRPGVDLVGVGNRAEHNLIHHTRHAGILFHGNDHYVGWNVLHDVVDNFDAGAIYSWQNSWVRRGGVIEHNFVHVSGKTPNPTTTMGIYLDDHTSDVDVRYNIVDYASQGLHNGGGQMNRWYGNVVMHVPTPRVIRQCGRTPSLAKELTNTVYCQSAVWKKRYPDLMKFFGRTPEKQRGWSPGMVMTNNLFVSCGDADDLNANTLKDMAETTVFRDNAVVTNDPGFVDYAGFDWRARTDSPYRDLIAGCAFEKMGLYECDLRASPAVKFGPGMTPAFPLDGPTKDAPDIVVWVDFSPLDKAQACATNLFLCNIIRWGPPKIRSGATVDLSPSRPWRGYRFAFTPEMDSTAEFQFGGFGASSGIATDYRNVRIAGADVAAPLGDKVFSVKAMQDAKFKVGVKKGVPVVVRYEARKGE